MPVIRSTGNAPAGFDSEDDPRKRKYLPPVRIDENDDKEGGGNAAGAALELAPDVTTEHTWKDKADQDESDYTRLRLFEDEESEEVHMRTKYLFDAQSDAGHQGDVDRRSEDRLCRSFCPGSQGDDSRYGQRFTAGEERKR
jgi:hypothetical protein